MPARQRLTHSRLRSAEFIDLRKRLKRAEMERDILEKTTTFFAKESA